jgi:hypothetical protein
MTGMVRIDQAFTERSSWLMGCDVFDAGHSVLSLSLVSSAVCHSCSTVHQRRLPKRHNMVDHINRDMRPMICTPEPI